MNQLELKEKIQVGKEKFNGIKGNKIRRKY